MPPVIPLSERTVRADRSIRGKIAIVGVGETVYYKHGQAPEPEVKLALQAILAACADAGIDPRLIDGFASYSNDRNDPSRLAAALGIPELRFSNMQWGGGGGAAARRPSATRRPPSPRATPTASSSSGHWRRDSSSASALRHRHPRSRAKPRSRSPTG
jgi:hypothetical protein